MKRTKDAIRTGARARTIAALTTILLVPALATAAPAQTSGSDLSGSDAVIAQPLLLDRDGVLDQLPDEGPPDTRGPGNGNGNDKDKGGGGSGGGSGGSGGSGGGGTAEPVCWQWTPAEQEFHAKINQERERREIPRLRLDPELSKVAERHSYEMREAGRLYHTPEDKLRNRVTRWEILGENVGVGASADSLHRAFMDSDAHRRIILHRPFNYVGVGVKLDGDRMWVTVIFEAYLDPGTTLEMPPGC